jgi:ketosteroid isomerase-like protein
MAQQAPDTTKEVAARAASYVEAFNRRDVAAAAQHWSEKGEYTLAGVAKPIIGRKAIAEALKKLLSTDEQFQLDLGQQRFRKVTDQVVLEEGLASLVSETHGTEYARYQVVHVKQNGTWYRDSIRETLIGTVKNSPESERDLEALVGSWQHQSDAGTLTVNSVWKHNKRIIARDFEIKSKDGKIVTVSEMIGWDPATGTIRSWSFDSQGGLEQAAWNHDGLQWLIKANATLPDGSKATEQRSLSVESNGDLKTRTIEQQFGGRLMPGSDPIILKRQSSNQNSTK